MKRIIIIDPAVQVAEVECAENLRQLSPLPCSYYTPVLKNFDELEAQTLPPAGIILLGSKSSVNEHAPWQRRLEKWLEVRIARDVPFFGICFGHQLIARMYGGRVEKLKEGQVRREFRNVRLEADQWWSGAAGHESSLRMFASHEEVVVERPMSLELAASSLEVEIEALKHPDYPLWTMQCHPEAIASFAKTRGYSQGVTDADFSPGHGLLKSFFEKAVSAP